MSRIDAVLATPVTDVVRPQQTAVESQAQFDSAVRVDQRKATEGTASSAPRASEVKEAAAQLKKVIEAASGQQLEFAVDEQGKELLVQIKDTKTGKVLRQVPGNEVLEMRKRIHELVGLMLDKTA